MSKKKPTAAQEKVAKKIFENSGETSISAAMREVGLSEAYAHNPQAFTKGQGWKSLMERYFPDDLIATVHLQLLTAKRLDHMIFPLSVDDKLVEELITSAGCILRKIVHGEQANHVYFWSPDNKAKNDALDKAYKLKGRYAPIRFARDPDPYEEMDDEELDRRQRELEHELKARKKLIEADVKKPKHEQSSKQKGA